MDRPGKKLFVKLSWMIFLQKKQQNSEGLDADLSIRHCGEQERLFFKSGVLRKSLEWHARAGRKVNGCLVNILVLSLFGG